MNADPFDKLREIVATVLEVDIAKIGAATSREKTKQWDSLNHLNICVAVGQEFGVEISADEMTRIRKVSDIVRLLRDRGLEIEADGDEAA